jgi:carnosine N-methyltransferase
LKHEKIHVSETNADKVRSTIRQVMRDWSEEGKEERDECYGHILRYLEQSFPEAEQRSGIRILTPGAGLGRLSWDIARLGFESQGNEFSYFMLLTSNFILNWYVQCMPKRSTNNFRFAVLIHLKSSLFAHSFINPTIS